MKNIIIVSILCSSMSGIAMAQTQQPHIFKADTIIEQQLDEMQVTARKSGTKRLIGAENGIQINREELFKAACCNLGESFTTNPSVDVSYSDAATGAKQIKLLGLSGTYVQMLTENMPNFRGVAAPYALDYVPGAWLSGIQVSKGSSSVRNGYESITGQIDVEYLKPDAEQGLSVNVYGNSKSRLEANADANVHIGNVSTEILAHYQNDFGHHDENNDGFLDQPNVRQYNVQNRWHGNNGRYIFHAGVGFVKENRDGGQDGHTAHHVANPFVISLATNRYEGYMKHAIIIDREHGTNIALLGNASVHNLDASFGKKLYSADEANIYGQLLFETHVDSPNNGEHKIAAGLSVNYDNIEQQLQNANLIAANERETTAGAYAQYTYNYNGKLTLMAGVRADHSSQFGTFVTPRFHVKFVPGQIVTMRLSAGKGYRTTHALAENNNLLASGRQMIIDDLEQEQAWNYGISSSFYIPIFNKTLKLNAEYYRTQFKAQTVVDYDTNPTQLHIANLDGRSYSNTFQVDATYNIVSGLELTAAYRINDVKCTYNGQLRQKPLTSRYKALATLSYKTPLGLWQADATLQLNGGGRLPQSYTRPDGSEAWKSSFGSYEQLSAQVTRWFRHFSIYVGGENLTNFRQKQTIVDAANPWSNTFEPTLIWGPVHGATFYAGVRVNVGRM